MEEDTSSLELQTNISVAALLFFDENLVFCGEVIQAKMMKIFLFYLMNGILI